jgi:glyoxylate utilization-related uncharacterized protein
MHVVTHCEAPLFQASGRSLMLMRRLQGMEAGPSDTLWVGLSEIDPGGGTTSSAEEAEKFYVCLEGEIEIAATKGDTTRVTVLRRLDSCRIEPHEARQLTNRSKNVAKVLTVMPRQAQGGAAPSAPVANASVAAAASAAL